LEEKMDEIKELIKLYKSKMEEIEDIKNEEEVLN
jgi:hypothetical protein